MKVREILPLEVNFEVKNFRKRFVKKKLELRDVCKRVFFLDAADYNNCGDLAIAEAIKLFFEHYFADRELIIIRQEQFEYYYKSFKREINSTDLIALSGGGNMGTAYPRFEAIRRKVIRNFPNNQIVIFPSTIDYSDDRYGNFSLNSAIKTYSSHRNLLLYAREKKTYSFFLKYFKANKILECPDIVFFLKNCARNITKDSPRKDNVGICIRRDEESKLSNKQLDSILNCLSENKMHYKFFTTMCLNEELCDNYEEIVHRKLEEIAKYSLVITDRLHATIFACLVETPCIAFDNANGKVFGVCEELENSNVIFAKPEGNFEEYLNRAFVLNPSLDLINFEDKFKQMANEIQGE